MSTILILRPCIKTRFSPNNPLAEGIHTILSFRCYNSHSYISHTSNVKHPHAIPSAKANFLSTDKTVISWSLVRKIKRWNGFRIISTYHTGSRWQLLDHTEQHSTSDRFSVHSITTISNDHSRKWTPSISALSYPRALFTSSTRIVSPEDPVSGVFPYTSAHNFDFSRCTNPAQLEKSIKSYLQSHPIPTEQALLAMLVACTDISKTVAPSHKRNHQSHRTQDQAGRKVNNNPDRFSTNLLQTILQSFEFTPEDVFKIAYSIYYNIPNGSFSSSSHSITTSHMKPSLSVTNAFLHVCEITGHFDEAWLVIDEMMHRKQGDVKPDLATYRYVLRAAAFQRRQDIEGSPYVAEIDKKVKDIIEYASDSLSKQSRITLLVKLGLGGLMGATAFKFTMMGAMALPSLSTFTFSRDIKEPVAVESYQPEGIIHFIASQEVALGIGLVAGLLTAGYFIRGSTKPMAVSTKQESILKSRNQQSHDELPCASILGLYFPDLKTTNKLEIQQYLRKSAGL